MYVDNRAIQAVPQGVITTTPSEGMTTTVNNPYYVAVTSGMANTIINTHGLNKPYAISIEAMDHGYLLRIGCKSFCFETYEKLFLYLGMYLKNPAEVEEQWIKGELKIV